MLSVGIAIRPASNANRWASMKLKERSQIGKWLYLPKLFSQQYETLRKYNSQGESERVAWLLAWQLVKPNKTCSGLWLIIRKIVVVLGLRQSH